MDEVALIHRGRFMESESVDTARELAVLPASGAMRASVSLIPAAGDLSTQLLRARM